MLRRFICLLFTIPTQKENVSCAITGHMVLRLISPEIKSLKYSDKSSQNALCEVSLSEL